MTISVKWNPTGCAAIIRDKAAAALYHGKGGPAFPEDFVPRVETCDLGVEDVFLAWEVARLASEGMSEEKNRALILLMLVLLAASREGNTRLPLQNGKHLERILDDFEATSAERAQIMDLLAEADGACRGTVNSGLFHVVGGPGAYRPLIIDHNCLYMQKLHVLEARVGTALRQRVEMTADQGAVPGSVVFDAAVENALSEVFNSQPEGPRGAIELDDEQKETVRSALSGLITVVSGRPGSGKTSIVASLLRVLARTGEPPLEAMALAAPTGKAADRMRQSIAAHLAAIPAAGAADRRLAAACPPASTLHRLLGYSPKADRFWHSERNPLAEKLVIVDECSMIDLAMMDRLLRAMGPGARLVLLGDADQLPSIEAGAVLRDLCHSRRAHEQGRVQVLKKSYRAREEDLNGRRILEVAAAINEGVSPAGAGGGKALVLRKKSAELAFAGVEQLSPGNEAQRLALLELWLGRLRSLMPDLAGCLGRVYVEGSLGFDHETTAALRVILSHYERFRILCVTRITAFGTGVEAVNDWFRSRWFSELKKEGDAGVSSHFLVGEPVLVTRNDYMLRLYNGDSGLVLRVAAAGTGSRPPEPMAVFPRGGGFAAFPLAALRGRLEPAWATTVHKAQGSEYENVAIILPEVFQRPLSRELLYTAVTRAKNSVVIAGSEEVLESGVMRALERASGVADALG